MRQRLQHRVDVVKCENKESSLEQFITGTLDALRAAEPDDSRCMDLLMLARSPASPVAKALTRVIARRQHGLLAVRAIFLSLDVASPAEAGVPVESDMACCELRHARDPRLSDAHEQLVLGRNASWIGDTMRRDPLKRDAFECFAAECATTAGWARTSFERLWQTAERIDAGHLMLDGASDPNGIAPDGLDPSLAAQPNVQPGAGRTGLTRN